MEVPVNIRTFISFQMFMSPGRNVSLGFTYINGVTPAQRNLLII